MQYRNMQRLKVKLTKVNQLLNDVLYIMKVKHNFSITENNRYM